jgi:hypothetical protein
MAIRFRFDLKYFLIFVAVVGLCCGVVVNRVVLHQSILSFERDLSATIEPAKSDYALAFPERYPAIRDFSPSVIGPNKDLVSSGKLRSPYQFEIGDQKCEIYLLASLPSNWLSRQLVVDLMYDMDEQQYRSVAHFIEFVLERKFGFTTPKHLGIE